MKKTLCTGLATGLFLLAMAASANANLIVNGSFEADDVPTGGWGVFPSIIGWDSISGPGIEIQDHAAGAPFDGAQFVELDSHANSAMRQVVSGVVAGQQYLLSFAYSPRPGVLSNSNVIEVFWNRSLLASISQDGDPSDTLWTPYSFTVNGIGTPNSLVFRARGTSESLGGYIDAVSLTTNPVPEPAAMLLFGTGLMGLAAVGRRKIS